VSYSALTEIDSICPACRKPIEDGQSVALVLLTKARIVEDYNEENDLAPNTVTTEFDWTDQVAFHKDCMKTSIALLRRDKVE
jgi:hypothetical protein